MIVAFSLCLLCHESMKLHVLVKACCRSKKTYNSGTNNVYFVVLQLLVICGSCHVTQDYCGRNLTSQAIICEITVASFI